MPVDVPIVGRGKSMNLVKDFSWTLRLEPTGPIPLVFEDPEDFIHEICGKILCDRNHSGKDQIAGFSEFTTQISSSVRITTLGLAKFLIHTSIHLITLTQFWIRMKHRFQEDYMTCSAMRLRTLIFSSSTALSCFRNTAAMGLDYSPCVH